MTSSFSAPSQPGVATLGVDHVYRWANQALLVLTGCELSTLRALPHHEVTAPDDLDAELAALAPLHAGRCEHVTWRRRFGRTDDVRRWCSVTAHALRDATGSLHEMVWIVVPDAQAVVMQDHLLRHLRADLQQVAAVLAHDGIQPTRMISSYVGLIAQRLHATEPASTVSHLASILKASDELRELLREAADYLRVPESSASAENLSLRHFAETVVEQLLVTAPSLVLRVGSDLEFSFAGEHIACCLRAALLFAWARSPAGVVDIRGSSRPGWSRIEVLAPGGLLDAGDTDRLFQLGARVVLAHGEGTRLPGLALARRVVRGSGGDMTIIGTGTGVCITMDFSVSGGTAPCNP